ncbi:hypothetical protein [Celeribacter marinus]|jgi:hypothetical protein
MKTLIFAGAAAFVLASTATPSFAHFYCGYETYVEPLICYPL